MYCSSDVVNAELIELPYAFEEDHPLQVSMLLILPHKSMMHSFEKWLSSETFTWANIASAVENMRDVRRNLMFPKFKITSALEMKSILSDLGMVIPFTKKANFSKVGARGTPLYVSKAFHAATVREFSRSHLSDDVVEPVRPASNAPVHGGSPANAIHANAIG